MPDILTRIDRAALALIRQDFQKCGDCVSLMDLAEILLTRLSEDLITAMTVVDIFDSLSQPSLTWTEFLDYLTRNSKESQPAVIKERENKVKLISAGHLLTDTSRHSGLIQAVRTKLGGDFQVITAETGISGLQVYKKTAEQGVVKVPGDRIIPDIVLRLPEELGSSGEYCRDFVCTDLLLTGTFAGELVAATINRRAVVVWEYGGGYKSQCRGVVQLEEGGDRVWWSKTLKAFLISMQMLSGYYQVVLLDPMTMTISDRLPREFKSRVLAVSDLRSISGLDFLTVLENSGRISLISLSREEPRADMHVTNTFEIKRKLLACELINLQWLLGCLDGAVVVFDPVNCISVKTMHEHKTSITSLTVVEQHFVTAEERGDVIFWNLQTLTPVQKLSSIPYSILHMVCVGAGLLLTASSSRLYFMKATETSNTAEVSPTSEETAISSVLFDYRQHRLLLVTSDAVTAVDMSWNTSSIVVRCPGISAAALELCRGTELAVAVKSFVKVVDLFTGDLTHEVNLQDPRRVSSVTFVASGHKLAVLYADEVLALFSAGRRIATLTSSTQISHCMPINLESMSSRMLLWGNMGNAFVVREAASIGRSDLIIDKSNSIADATVLAVGVRCSHRLGEVSGLLVACVDRLVSIDPSGEISSSNRLPLGALVTHVCHLTTAPDNNGPAAKIARSILDKVGDAVSFSYKKRSGKIRASFVAESPPLVSVDSMVSRSYVIFGEGQPGLIRVFDDTSLTELFCLHNEDTFHHLFPIQALGCVATVKPGHVRLWSIEDRHVVFDSELIDTGEARVKVNAVEPFNQVKKQLVASLTHAVLSRDLDFTFTSTSIPDMPLRKADTIDLEISRSVDRSLPRIHTRRLQQKKATEEVVVPRTPRTLSQEFFKAQLLRKPEVEPVKTTKSRLEEELNIVDERFQVKKENVVVKQTRKESKLSTKIAYSVSGSVFRRMDASMTASDFASEYTRVLSRQATPTALSRQSTAPTRAATAIKSRSN